MPFFSKSFQYCPKRLDFPKNKKLQDLIDFFLSTWYKQLAKTYFLFYVFRQTLQNRIQGIEYQAMSKVQSVDKKK